MGCSYDPVPYEYSPSPEEQWLEDNHFNKIRVAHTGGGGIDFEACTDCGGVFYRNSNLHPPVCPANPREVVPLRSIEELNDAKFKRVRYH